MRRSRPRRSWRAIELGAPIVAILVAALPIWQGAGLSLTVPWQEEDELVVLHEAPIVAPTVAPSADVEDERVGPPASPSTSVPTAEVAAARPMMPMLAVVGVGLQGLVVRSEPGDGEKLAVAADGTDLRDLGAETEAHGRPWKRVRTDDGVEGWVASDFLLGWDGVDGSARTVALLARSAGGEPSAPLDRSWLSSPPDARSITPDQLKDGQTLSTWEAFAACAPAATVAFARATGQNLTLDEAVVAAQTVGWTAAQGIPGPRSELALLASLGIEAHQRGESEDTIDWDHVIGDVQAGLPVIVVTVNHYFVAERYDPETGKLDFGNSATVLAGARGQRWFAPGEIGWIGYGSPFTTIHLGKGSAATGEADPRAPRS